MSLRPVQFACPRLTWCDLRKSQDRHLMQVAARPTGLHLLCGRLGDRDPPSRLHCGGVAPSDVFTFTCLLGLLAHDTDRTHKCCGCLTLSITNSLTVPQLQELFSGSTLASQRIATSGITQGIGTLRRIDRRNQLQIVASQLLRALTFLLTFRPQPTAS